MYTKVIHTPAVSSKVVFISRTVVASIAVISLRVS